MQCYANRAHAQAGKETHVYMNMHTCRQNAKDHQPTSARPGPSGIQGWISTTSTVSWYSIPLSVFCFSVESGVKTDFQSHLDRYRTILQVEQSQSLNQACHKADLVFFSNFLFFFFQMRRPPPLRIGESLQKYFVLFCFSSGWFDTIIITILYNKNKTSITRRRRNDQRTWKWGGRAHRWTVVNGPSFLWKSSLCNLKLLVPRSSRRRVSVTFVRATWHPVGCWDVLL